MAYLKRVRGTQPCRNASKRTYRVIGLVRWRRGRGSMKIEPVKVKVKCINEKPMQQGETTYRGRAQATQPPKFPSKRCYWVYRPRCRCSRIKIEAIKVNQAQEVETTHQVRASITQPCGNAPNRRYRVHRTRRRHGRIKIKSTNVSQT